MTWAPWSASTHATRRAGPGSRDDKKREPCSTGPGLRGDKEHACGAVDPGLRRDDDKKEK